MEAPGPLMTERLDCIVLHLTRYSDTHSIAQLLTRQRGRVSVLLPVGDTPAKRRRAALFMPLSVVEVVANFAPGRDIATLRETVAIDLHPRIHGDPARTAVAMFVAEVVTRVVQGSEDSAALFDFVSQAVAILDRSPRSPANFHICFLYHLGALLGIQPDVDTYTDGAYFDLQEGVFTTRPGSGSALLRPDYARALYAISRISFANYHLFRYNREERNEVVTSMLRYYQLHNSTLGSLRSIAVLSQLFT